MDSLFVGTARSSKPSILTRNKTLSPISLSLYRKSHQCRSQPPRSQGKSNHDFRRANPPKRYGFYVCALASALICSATVVSATRADKQDVDETSTLQDIASDFSPHDFEQAKKLSKWKTRWQEDNIGFHLENVHPLLIRHLHLLLQGGGSSQSVQRVFLPLCGKTLDLTWLAVQGNCRVFGLELSPLAAEQYFHESHLPRSTTSIPGWRLHTSGIIAFIEGDLFKLKPRVVNTDTTTTNTSTFAISDSESSSHEQTLTASSSGGSSSEISESESDNEEEEQEVTCSDSASSSSLDSSPTCSTEERKSPSGTQQTQLAPMQSEALSFLKGENVPMDAVWDRGSMVAIDPSLRHEYASLMAALLRPGGRILLVGVHYDEAIAHGPPFSLRYQTLKNLYEPLGFTVELVTSQEMIHTASPRMKSSGLKSMTEALYLLTKVA